MVTEVRRTYEGLRQAGVNYHSLRQGGRLGRREDLLGTQHVPSEEATFERPADLRLDFELAIRCKSIPFLSQEVTFDYLANHGGDYWARNRMASGRWAPLTGGAIHRIADDTLLAMVCHCGGRCRC